MRSPVIDDLADYYRQQGLTPSQWHIGAEHPELENHAIRILAGVGGPRILEIGFQAGGFAVPMILRFSSEAGFRYVGIDDLAYENAVDATLIEAYLRSRGATQGVRFIVEDADRALVALDAEPFDLILIDHHKPLYSRDLATVLSRGLLKPGGFLLLHDMSQKASPFRDECEIVCRAHGRELMIVPSVPGGLAVASRSGAGAARLTSRERSRLLWLGLRWTMRRLWRRITGPLRPAAGRGRPGS